MHKPLNPLLRYAMGCTLALLLLNGGAIHLLLNQHVQQQQQQAESIVLQMLGDSQPDEARLNQLTTLLPVQALAVVDARQQVVAQVRMLEFNLISHAYPALYSEFPLVHQNLVIRMRLKDDLVVDEWAQLGVLALITLLVGLWGSVLVQRRHQQTIEQRLAEEIRTQDHSVGPLPTITHALQELEYRQQQQLDLSQQQLAELELRTNQDALTGVLTRACFRHDLGNLLAQSGNASQLNLLGIVRATELSIINQQRGFPAGDQYLTDVAQLITRACKRFPHNNVYRLSGSDFAILLPNGAIGQAESLGSELQQHFEQYRQEQTLECVAYTGLTLFRTGQQPELILGRSDLALAKAQTGPTNGWYLQERDAEDYLQGERHWKTVIEDVIARKAILLMQQPIQTMNISIRGYIEIYARFMGENDQPLPTETILAMAQRHDLLVKLEQHIIELIVHQYSIRAVDQRWGINLSANALINNTFVIWLERLLLRSPSIAANLVFELDEDLLDCNLAASIRLFEMLRRVGSRASISKFGKGLGSFRLYRELKPDYIKLDPGLITVLERDHTSQQFIRMIVEVSHRLGCVVVAEGVENVAQKQLLEALYVDAIQGYLVARPAPLPLQSPPSNLELL